MPWPQNSRTTQKPCSSACDWISVTDVAEKGAGLDRVDAAPHAFVGDLGQATRLDRRFADEEHAAGVAVIAVLDDGDVDVDYVAGLELLVGPGTPWQTTWLTEVQIDFG